MSFFPCSLTDSETVAKKRQDQSVRTTNPCGLTKIHPPYCYSFAKNIWTPSAIVQCYNNATSISAGVLIFSFQKWIQYNVWILVTTPGGAFHSFELCGRTISYVSQFPPFSVKKKKKIIFLVYFLQFHESKSQNLQMWLSHNCNLRSHNVTTGLIHETWTKKTV